jgi:hypothetical protein
MSYIIHIVIHTNTSIYLQRIQSLPLLKSTSECEQTLNEDNIISQVVCLETHTFRPFSKEESGATTIVASNIRLVNTTDRTQATQGQIEQS